MAENNNYPDTVDSRSVEIIETIINQEEYDIPPQSRLEEVLLELKEAIEQGGGGGSITIDPTPTQGSNNAVSSGGVYTALQGVSPINYSTTEQDTGRKWIDGKPIYQKTFTNAFSETFIHQTWNNLSNVSTSDIASCVDVKISCHDTYSGSSYIAFMNAYYFRIYNGVVQLYAFEDWNITIDAITIWYTKTTDTAE